MSLTEILVGKIRNKCCLIPMLYKSAHLDSHFYEVGILYPKRAVSIQVAENLTKHVPFVSKKRILHNEYTTFCTNNQIQTVAR